MTLALETAGGAVALLVLVGVVLRMRKLRRDKGHEPVSMDDRRLVAPPPSPYEPSKGFRLVNDSGEPLERPPVQRPRLDPARHYVFSDSATPNEDALPVQPRHSNDWFLTRSAHRSTTYIVLRAVGVVILIAVIIGIVTTYYVDHSHHPQKGSTGTTTTTTTTAPPTTTTLPVAFRPTTTSGEDADYSIPATRYRVTVTGARGESWTEYSMGAANTLEWQGAVDQGQDKSLVMTGNSEITLGSPSSAAVSVDGHRVIFPASLPVTLVLVFDAKTAGSTNSA